MMKKTLVWALQIVCVLILAPAAWAKLSADSSSVALFNELGMGSVGRVAIGLIESFCTVLLLTETLAGIGALLSFSIMLGAVIAHTTVIGFSDLALSLSLLALLASSCLVMILRKDQLPLLGSGGPRE